MIGKKTLSVSNLVAAHVLSTIFNVSLMIGGCPSTGKDGQVAKMNTKQLLGSGAVVVVGSYSIV